MKVAIVHELLVKLGGAERVVELLWEMFPEADMYTLLYDEKKVGGVFPKERVQTSFLQKYFRLGIPRRLLIGQMDLAIESFDLREYDLVISSSSAFAHGVITGSDTQHICYCHSPARYLWDQTFAVQEQQGRGGLLAPLKRWLGPKLFHRLRQWDVLAAPRADVLIANSQAVQKRISKYWSTKSQLLYPPVRTDIFTPQQTHEDYFLIVSALSPYKQIELAVEVFNDLPKHKLVIIGDGVLRQHLQNIAGPNIEVLGRKSDETVKEYLQNCRALLFPGEDDFGIVPVEAMACGKPVIAYGRGGALETVVEGETGVFFDKPTTEVLQHALLRFFDMEKGFDAQKIAKHAQQFSEQQFIDQLRKIIDA